MEAATVLLALFLMTGALILSVLIRSQFSSGVEDLHQQIALAIDDEADILGLVVEALGFPNGKVVTLQDSNQLEAALHQGPFDAVLCDLKMPGRDGLAVLRELRKQQPGLAQKFVLMTGNLADADLAASELEGVPILAKPFTLTRLRELLNHVRDRAS